jgi:phage recombination protein Bet
MSTALAAVNREEPRMLSYTPDQVDLLKRTICKGATDDEFLLFMTVARKTGLDPFSKQIHAVKRWNPTTERNEMVIQTGIDGYRLIAQRSGELDGQDGPYWCGTDGKWKDVWLESTPPAAAKVIVYRKGCAHPFIGVARYAAYVQRTKKGEPNRMWNSMPDNQLAKCAESLALRKAFPAELSRLYTEEEMEQAELSQPPAERTLNAEPTPASSAQPAPAPPPLPPAAVIPERFLKDMAQLKDVLSQVPGDVDKIADIHDWWNRRKGKMPSDLWDEGDRICQAAAASCVRDSNSPGPIQEGEIIPRRYWTLSTEAKAAALAPGLVPMNTKVTGEDGKAIWRAVRP